MKTSFASDNYTGAHPAALAAIAAANEGHAKAYGDDPITARLSERTASVFGPDARIYPVFNGTGANVVALSLLARSYEAVICAESSHIHQDECGAAERFLGTKLVLVPTSDGKLTPELVRERIRGVGDPHRVQPKVISISQTTEFGTLYTPDELRALSGLAREHGMSLHVDGARIANAAAALGCSLRDITTDAGVDILSFGGTKNGLLGAEAVVTLRKGFEEEVPFRRKQAMQLASKMRFISAQLLALLGEDELWRKNAAHANAMAKLLESELAGARGVQILFPVRANSIFAALPEAAIAEVQREFFFYVWDERQSLVRWMTAFDTREEDVRRFAAAIRRSAAQSS